MRMSTAPRAWCAFAFVAAMVPALEARATYNPNSDYVAYPGSRDAGPINAWCSDGDNCVQGDQVVFTATQLSTENPNVSLNIDWSRTVITGDDVPWCVLQIGCHDKNITITDVEEWGSCSQANALAKDDSGTQCDIADNIMIMVGVNRGGFE